MERRKFFLLTAATAAAAMIGARADQWSDRDHNHDHDRDHDHDHDHGDHGHHDDWETHEKWHWRDEHGVWHSDHDRYWREGYGNRGYIDRDRIFDILRRHNYRRFVGDPYWFQGRYVVKTYDRWGNLVFVEVDPYSGDFIGVVRF
ncbi:MAG: hypothetical protein WCA81_19785 [Rhizomicrobium sp.]